MLPIVVFFLGIEGSGHHMINAYLNHAGASFDPYIPHLTHETTFDFSQKFMKYVKSRPYTIITLESFPSGRPIHSENHPSIDTIQTLPIDLRLVKLYRHPPDAVCSAHRRFGKQDSDILLSSRIAKDSLSILNRYKSHETVFFNRALRNQTYVLNILNRVLTGTQITVTPIRIHHPANYSCPHRDWVENYFRY